MSDLPGTWINVVAVVFGVILLMYGVLGLREGFDVMSTFVAVVGFLVAGWSVLSYRRFQRGTPESEVEGGHTIE